jgi:hypothetical protein
MLTDIQLNGTADITEEKFHYIGKGITKSIKTSLGYIESYTFQQFKS